MNKNTTNPTDPGIIIRLSLFLVREYNCTFPTRKTIAVIAALTSSFFRIIASIN